MARCAAAAPRLRVSAQLIDAATGMALWSERYDGDRADAFALEDDIAGQGRRLAAPLADADRTRAPADRSGGLRTLSARAPNLADDERRGGGSGVQSCWSAACGLAPDFADRLGPRWPACGRCCCRATATASASPRTTRPSQRPSARSNSIPIARRRYAALSLLKPAFGDHAEKLRLVNEALKRTPNDPSLHVARAAWLYGVGRV